MVAMTAADAAVSLPARRNPHHRRLARFRGGDSTSS